VRHDAREALERLKALLLSVSFALAKEPPPPSRTDWTRLVPPPVLTGHVSSLQQQELAPGVYPSLQAALAAGDKCASHHRSKRLEGVRARPCGAAWAVG